MVGANLRLECTRVDSSTDPCQAARRWLRLVQSPNLGNGYHWSLLRPLNRPRLRRVLLPSPSPGKDAGAFGDSRKSKKTGFDARKIPRTRSHDPGTRGESNRSRAPRRPAATVIAERQDILKLPAVAVVQQRFGRPSFKAPSRQPA
jgi:hypothetical protein